MRRLSVAACIAVLAGCASGHIIPTLHYVITPTIGVQTGSVSKQSLGIRSLVSARPYKANIVFRRDPNVLENLDNLEWAEWPRDVLNRALMDAVVATGRFQDVGDASDLSAPDFILTGEVRTFDLLEYTEPWTAECTVRIELRELRSGVLKWSATLTASTPLEENTPSALPEAMSTSVSSIVQQAANALAAL